MKKIILTILMSGLFVFSIFFPLSDLTGSDWPIYKGNIYFTGNNDEVIVKNNNLKWLYQADERVFNPIVSDGKVYFVDIKANLYCLDEEYGKLLWKVDIKKISSQFRASAKSAGKIKYPLIKDNFLFITDSIAIYAFNKQSGEVVWAQTGMRQEEMPAQTKGLAGISPLPLVDGIYADPIILDDNIYYGTRNMFLSRETRRGHLNWDNRTIKTYSAFPTFYDNLIFTQSMDYSTGRYMVYCLNSSSGKEIWSREIQKPLTILPPVVYKNRVYIPSQKSMYCLDLKTGDRLWLKDYTDYITSSPSFTDRAILFTKGNSSIAVINPDNGELVNEINVAPKSSPLFVTIRDQIYIAHNEFDLINNKTLPFTILRAINFSENQQIWQYKTPFPGAVSQPSASKGILFLPAGNYVYAIGTEYYPKIVQGGSGYAVVPHKKPEMTSDPEKTRINEKPDGSPVPTVSPIREREPKKIETRKIKVSITDKDKRGIPSHVDITKREKDDIVYSKRVTVDKTGDIDVPGGDNVELLVTADKYIPQKVIIDDKDREKEIVLDKIERGKGFVIDNIQFEIDKAYLKKESLDILDKLIKIMRENSGLKIEVRGHTDSTGPDEHNQKLSERRADCVIEYMIKNGISPERLRSVGLGETKPIATNATAEGRKLNRRTEFYFIE